MAEMRGSIINLYQTLWALFITFSSTLHQSRWSKSSQKIKKWGKGTKRDTTRKRWKGIEQFASKCGYGALHSCKHVAGIKQVNNELHGRCWLDYFVPLSLLHSLCEQWQGVGNITACSVGIILSLNFNEAKAGEYLSPAHGQLSHAVGKEWWSLTHNWPLEGLASLVSERRCLYYGSNWSTITLWFISLG